MEIEILRTPKQFLVVANYGLADETILEEFNVGSEAINWAKRYARRDMGNWDEIAAVTFDSEGEVHTLWRIKAEDFYN